MKLRDSSMDNKDGSHNAREKSKSRNFKRHTYLNVVKSRMLDGHLSQEQQSNLSKESTLNKRETKLYKKQMLNQSR